MGLSEWLGILGLVIGVASVGYAQYLHRQSLEDKRLGVGQIAPTEIAGIPPSAQAPIKMDYGGVPVRAVFRSYVLLWNKGYRAIESSDFVREIVANCGSEERILGCGVFMMDVATNVSVEHSLNDQQTKIQVTMLRPGEAAILYFDSESKTAIPNLILEMKDSKNVIQARIDQYFWIQISIFFVIFVLLLLLTVRPDNGPADVLVRSTLVFIASGVIAVSLAGC